MMAVNRRISLDGKQPDQISEDCIICCEKVTDKAFVNNCLHYFCFKCIQEWVKVRAVCPLCVQPIDSIINNVRSADDYDLQPVEPPATDVLSNYLDADVDWWATVEDDDYDDFDSDVELSSDEIQDVVSSSDSDDAENDYHCAMDEDSCGDSDVSFEDAAAPPVELFSNSDDDEEEEEEVEVKSYLSSDSEMDDDGWQVDDMENENSDNDESDMANNSDEEDYTYNYLCDSEDNDSEPNVPLEEYATLSESEYEYFTDNDYNYAQDEFYDDVSDIDYY